MINNPKLEERKVNLDTTIIESLKRMDSLDSKALLISDDNFNYLGIVSIGDIQRAILKNISLEEPISKIIRSKTNIAQEDWTLDRIKHQMIEFRMEFLPVVSKQNRITQVHFWDELFLGQKLPPKTNFQLPVVIMAGGLGTRLKPLTNVLPKPLIPIGDTTILEEIFSRFNSYGCTDFFLSVNYKSELIKYYIESKNLSYNIEYFQETEPLGTAGSLSLLKHKINQTFIVHNCDILVDEDYSNIIDYHKSHKNEITLVAALKNYAIPYGTITTSENGQLLNITEKPNLTFQINSGMYILEPHLLDEIPEAKFFHITELIEQIQQRQGKVGVFPISENSWKDIGNWDEYITNFIQK